MRTELEMQKEKLIDQEIDYGEWKKILISNVRIHPRAAINIIDHLLDIKRKMNDIENKIRDLETLDDPNDFCSSIFEDIEAALEVRSLLDGYTDPSVKNYINSYIGYLKYCLEKMAQSHYSFAVRKK